MRIYRNILISLFLVGVMGLLAACASVPASPGAVGPATEVTVKLSEFSIQSSLTSFQAGKAYHFVVTNEGKTAHELMLMPQNMSGMDMGTMDKEALATISNIAPGQTSILDYTFPADDKGKSIEFSCHLPGHYEAGMKQSAAIQ